MLQVTIGFLLDCLLGDPHGWYHPIRSIGKLIRKSEKLIRRIFPDTSRGETAGGVFLCLAVTGISTALPWLTLKAAGTVSKRLRLFLECIMCYQILAARALRDESMKVYKALEKGDVEEGRRAVSMIVGRDTDSLTVEGIRKAAIETVAENTSDGVTAPLLFMAAGGAPMGFFYKAVNTMDSMIGYHNDRYEYLGKAAAKLDDLVNWLPARISGLLMVASAFLSALWGDFDGKNAWKIFLRDRRKHKSPNSAQTEAACAGALGLSLAGDASYFGSLVKKPVIGEGKRAVENQDICKANQLMYITAFLSLLAAGGISYLMVWIGKFFRLPMGPHVHS
ncbi:adenosylcobinamide-phosphate synthase CbiB [Lachnospiraceae bacterium 62-35]